MLISQSQISSLLQKAAHYQQQGNFQDAEACCLKVCALIPSQPDTLHLLAIIYAQTKQYALANDYFIKAIAAAPQRADFLGNYANALWEQGNIDDAVIYCKESLALNAKQADVHNILGNVYLAQNRIEAAIACFRNALQCRPNFPQALNNLGNALQKMNKMEEAVTSYLNALKLHENYPEAYNNLGQALKTLGRIEEARNYFLKAIALRPNFTQAILNHQEVATIWLVPLEGNKLYLRRYCKEDAGYLRQCYQNTQFMAQYNHYIPRHQRAEELALKLEEANKMHPCQLKSIDWIIVKKGINQPIGIANLVEIEFVHRRAEFLIGFPDTNDHAKGLGLEATLSVLDFAFNKVKLNKITSLVYEDNTSSQQNALALGFIQESMLRDHIFDSTCGKFLNLWGMGMTVNDFRNNPRIAKLSNRLLARDITHPIDKTQQSYLARQMLWENY